MNPRTFACLALLWLCVLAPTALAQSLPALREFYFDDDHAARPIRIVEGTDDAAVEQLMRTMERRQRHAELATALAAKPDYVALGPIFFTTLKSMRFEPQGIPKITEWKKRIGNIPLVAIGGIKFEQSAEIFAAGADSIAVVSDVTQNADPDARVRQWLGIPAEAA